MHNRIKIKNLLLSEDAGKYPYINFIGWETIGLFKRVNKRFAKTSINRTGESLNLLLTIGIWLC